MEKWGGALRLVGVGWLIAVSLITPIVAGIWLDRKLSSGFVFTIVGIFAGLLLASLSVYRLLKEFMQDIDDKKERK